MSFTGSEAVKPILDKVNITLKSKGGEGAIREIVDFILKKN